jgi:ABC-type amino acid transport system permease subunit
VSSAIVVAVIYIGLSMALSALANRLELRSRRTAVAE